MRKWIVLTAVFLCLAIAGPAQALTVVPDGLRIVKDGSQWHGCITRSERKTGLRAFSYHY